jgi:hypothetical protein
MNEVRMAMVERLRSDPYLASVLGSFESLPAVFAPPPIPVQRPVPYVSVHDALFNVPSDTKTREGRQIVIPVRSYAAADGRHSLIDHITRAVHRLFHRQPLESDSWVGVTAAVYGPVQGPEDEGQVYNREQTVHLLLSAK